MKVICIALGVSLAACSYALAQSSGGTSAGSSAGASGCRIDAFERQHHQRYGRITGS